MPGNSRAVDHGLMLCHACGILVKKVKAPLQHCPRCNSQVHLRKKDSLLRTWIYLFMSMLLYIPANLLPIMQTEYIGRINNDTIMSGVLYFLRHGDWPLALIIFVASVLVPLLKIFALLYLLITVQLGHVKKRQQRTYLFRVTELVGRWSMVDVFVIALLAALVHLGTLATITPGIGAAAFSLVVIFTLLAANSFDPRLIWDNERLAK